MSDDDALTPDEHDDLRSLVLAGSQRIGHDRRRRAAWGSGIIALALVAGVAGPIAIAALLGPAHHASTMPTASATPSSASADALTLLVSRNRSGDSAEAIVSGTLAVNTKGCLTVGSELLIAPPGSTVDASTGTVNLTGYAPARIGEDVSWGGGHETDLPLELVAEEYRACLDDAAVVVDLAGVGPGPEPAEPDPRVDLVATWAEYANDGFADTKRYRAINCAGPMPDLDAAASSREWEWDGLFEDGTHSNMDSGFDTVPDGTSVLVAHVTLRTGEDWWVEVWDRDGEQPCLSGAAPFVDPVGAWGIDDTRSPYIEFDEGGGFEGYDGCNAFGGRWMERHGGVELYDIASDAAACPDDATTTQGATDVRISGDRRFLFVDLPDGSRVDLPSAESG